MRIKDMSPYYGDLLNRLAQHAGKESLWKKEAESATFVGSLDFDDHDELLEFLHFAQRVDRIFTAGLENDWDLKRALQSKQGPVWSGFKSPPADIDLQHNLAEKLYNAGPDDYAVINLGDGSREIGPYLVQKCLDAGIPFIVNFEDMNFNALTLNKASEEGIKKLGDAYVEKMSPVTTSMGAYGGLPDEEIVTPDQDKSNRYQEIVKPISEKTSAGDLYYTLTVIPSPKDAELDEIPYEDYVKLFFEMCDQPWEQIDKAQQRLIAEFNVASKVRITNDDGTDVTMELTEKDGSHYTFCNSLIAKNVPGSEIFSAPRKDSVNGTVVAKGKFTHGGDVIEDLTLVFNNGELVAFGAAKNAEAFERILSIDEGAHYVGELGIGTNPHLKQHVANGLLVEKIGGSFHLALGRAYSYTEYEGVPVKVDNGNKSKLHWDITTMLHGKGGVIELDGRKVMEDGKWIDAKYDVLNRGWEAVPEPERPPYWQDYYKKPSL